MKRLPLAAPVIAVALLALSRLASATPITISGSMEGNLPVRPGDTVRAGFDFSMLENHPNAQVNISGSVTLFYVCANGTRGNFSLPVGASYTDPKNDQMWLPSASQGSPLVYQGFTIGPNACRGQLYHVPSATFSADVSSNDDDDFIYVRFHYSDNSPGNWSIVARVKGSSVSDRH